MPLAFKIQAKKAKKTLRSNKTFYKHLSDTHNPPDFFACDFKFG